MPRIVTVCLLVDADTPDDAIAALGALYHENILDHVVVRPDGTEPPRGAKWTDAYIPEAPYRFTAPEGSFMLFRPQCNGGGAGASQCPLPAVTAPAPAGRDEGDRYCAYHALEDIAAYERELLAIGLLLCHDCRRRPVNPADKTDGLCEDCF